MNDMTPPIQLDRVSTAELNAELVKREGVTATFLGPEDELKKVVRGPACVIVNRD